MSKVRQPKAEPLSPVTTAEAAELLGVHVRTVLRLIERGRLRARKLPGGRTMPYIIDHASVDALLAERTPNTSYKKKAPGQSAD